MYCMDISPTIIDAAFDGLADAKPELRLQKILSSLQAIDAKTLLNENDPATTKGYDRLHQLSHTLYGKSSKSQTNLLARYLNTLHGFVGEAFAASSLQKLFVFLMAHHHYHFELKKVFETVTISNANRETMSKKIVQILKTIQHTVKSRPGARDYEKKLVRDAEAAIQDGSMNDFYKLVIGLERSGMGMHWNFLLESLVRFLFYLDMKAYVERLETIDSPHGVVYYLQNLSVEDLVQVAETPMQNEWAIVEVCRQLDLRLNNKVREQAINAVAEKLIFLTSHRHSFFLQAMKFFDGSVTVMAAFGKACRTLPINSIQQVLQTCLELKDYDNWQQAYNVSLEQMKLFVNATKLCQIVSIMYQRWKSFVESLILKEDYYQFNLLKTDFDSYVITHYVMNCSGDWLEEELTRLVTALNDMDSEWHISPSKKITRYFWYSSQVYLLALALRQKGITVKNNIIEILRWLADNKIHQSRYRLRNEKQPMQQAYDVLTV